jgi:hypothetical protein
MRRTNGSRNFGQEGSRRVWGSMNHDRMRQTERLRGRNSSDGRESSYNRNESDYRNNQGYSGRFEDEDRWNHYNMKDENGYYERENPDYGWGQVSENDGGWKDKGVYSTITEDDIRSELDYRGHKTGTGRTGRGSDYMDEDHRWRMRGSDGSLSNEGNEYRGSERSGRMGRRRRVTHD